LLITVGLYRYASARRWLWRTNTKLRRYCVWAAELFSGRNHRFRPTPPLLAPPLRLISLEFHGDFWHWKTRDPELLYGVVTVILGLTTFVQLILVTDGRTDGRTDGQTDKHTMTANTALA